MEKADRERKFLIRLRDYKPIRLFCFANVAKWLALDLLYQKTKYVWRTRRGSRDIGETNLY